VCLHYWLSGEARPPLSNAVATSSDDTEKRNDDDDGKKDSQSLMLAENMDAQQQQQQQQEQKFRAKRDLDADEIRELFESSQNARRDDDYEPGCTSLAFTQINCLSTL